MAALIEDYEAAWNAYDADAIRDVLTEGFRLEGYSLEGTQTQLDYVLDEFVEWDSQIEYLGDPFVVKTGGSASGGYDVSALWVETAVHPQELSWYGVTNYRVVEEDGTLKIHRANPSYGWFQY